MSAIGHWLARVGSIADTSGDTNEDRLKHRILIYAGLLMSGGGLLWGSISFAFGLRLQSLVPFGFQWSLGGFFTSGAMMYWGLLALLGSLTLDNRKSTWRWRKTPIMPTCWPPPGRNVRRAARNETLPLFTQARKALVAGQVKEARDLYTQVAEKDPGDGAAALLKSRCQGLVEQGVPADFNCTVRLERK